MGNPNQPSTSRLMSALREAQDHTLRLDDPNERARARARLLQAIDRVEAAGAAGAVVQELPGAAVGSRNAGWRWGMGTLAAAACAAAIVFALPGLSGVGEDALTLELDGVAVAAEDRGVMIIADQSSRALEFSDSTTIALASGGRMHLEDIRSNGATVVLDAGEVALAVHHEDDTSWQVAAGPWNVHVTGTQFSVAWEPAVQTFRVAVTEGSVRVEGPEGEIANLRGGDSLIRERGKATIEPETQLAERNGPKADLAGDGNDESGEGPDAALLAELDALEPSPSKPKSSGAKPTSWDTHFDNSEYDAAWQALSELAGGIHGEAKHANADTLLDLADIAHYTKHRDDARKLLEQLRERFPGSDEAGKAAFALGRLAATSGSQAKAATWFELYLDELPNGSLAGDALSRLIDSYDALGHSAKANATAQRYLARFPNGPHADKAAKLLAR